MLFEPAFSLEERELPPPDEIVAKQRPAIISTTPAAQLKQIEALFKLFDTAGNSLIDRDDLKRAYVKLGYLCTDDKAIDKHLAQLDLSGDGGEYGIDFNQFALGILNGNSFIFKALYSFDDKAAVEQIPGLDSRRGGQSTAQCERQHSRGRRRAACGKVRTTRSDGRKAPGLTPPYMCVRRRRLIAAARAACPWRHRPSDGSVFGVSDSTPLEDARATRVR